MAQGRRLVVIEACSERAEERMEGLLPTVRQSALAFTEGVRLGWLTSDLMAWADEHLLATSRLDLGRLGGLQCVREPGFGLVALQLAKSKEPRKLRSTTASQIPQLLESARQRVLQALDAAIDRGHADFVNAALYSSHVVRAKTDDGRHVWTVRLTEDMSLSDWVLALFAADALEHPADYETDLALCDACGSVTLGLGAHIARRECPSHPFGSLQTDRARTPTPLRVLPVRVRDSIP
jgi:hypothetical protein